MAGDDEPQISILDARLAEIDRRLSHIQSGLAEDVAAPAPGGLPPRIAVPEPGARPSAQSVAPAVARGVRRVAPPPAPARPPASARPAAPAPGGQQDDAGDDAQLVVAELRGLIADHARLLERLGEILASGERVLAAAHATPAASGPPAAPSPLEGSQPASGESAEEITVSAGPFATIAAVRGFERALRSLPGVDSAEVRGYEGGDRALVDVHLSSETA